MDRSRKSIGLLAHELYLYPELSARQNLAFFAQLYGLDAAETVDRALSSAGLADRADDDVTGILARHASTSRIERALLHRPRLVLMDEPFTGLDDAAVGLVRARLLTLAGAGALVVLATHNLDLADGLVTRVAIAHGGRLVADEAAGTGLRNRYRSLVGN